MEIFSCRTSIREEKRRLCNILGEKRGTAWIECNLGLGLELEVILLKAHVGPHVHATIVMMVSPSTWLKSNPTGELVSVRIVCLVLLVALKRD